MGFDDLDEDIIPQILAFCDVQGVLRMSQTSKLLYHLASKTFVWRILIQDLIYRGVLDARPIEKLLSSTADDLRDEVKRTLSGPETWLPSSASTPTLLREVSMQFPYSVESDFMEVLPGGEYLVVHRSLFLRLWSIQSEECIWSWQTPRPYFWSLDVPAGGRDAFVLVCAVRTGSLETSITIIHVELETRKHRPVFDHASFGLACLTTPIIVGDHFAFAADRSQREDMLVLLVNWRLQKFVAFKLQNLRASPTNVALTANHLIVSRTSSQPPYKLILCTYAIDESLSQDWQPLHDLTLNRGKYVGVSPITYERLRDADGCELCDPDVVRLKIYKSPLRADAYFMKLYVSVSVAAVTDPIPPSRSLVQRLLSRRTYPMHTPPQVHGTILTFALTPPSTPAPSNRASTSCRSRILPAVPALPRWGTLVLSLAGYAVFGVPPNNDVIDAIVLRRHPNNNIVSLFLESEGWRIASLTLESGGLLMVKGDTARLVYYR